MYQFPIIIYFCQSYANKKSIWRVLTPSPVLSKAHSAFCHFITELTSISLILSVAPFSVFFGLLWWTLWHTLENDLDIQFFSQFFIPVAYGNFCDSCDSATSRCVLRSPHRIDAMYMAAAATPVGPCRLWVPFPMPAWVSQRLLTAPRRAGSIQSRSVDIVNRRGGYQFETEFPWDEPVSPPNFLSAHSWNFAYLIQRARDIALPARGIQSAAATPSMLRPWWGFSQRLFCTQLLRLPHIPW